KLERLKSLKDTHWVVSAIEHDAVLESFAEVERLGGKVTHIQPDAQGIFSAESVLHALRPETVLLSIGWVNNEIGVVQPLRDISRTVLQKNPDILIHSDAGQGPLYLAPHVHTLGVDLLSLGSNKLYGPHGVGALYLSNRVQIASILYGGKQERGLRPGTENVALAVGFAAALTAVGKERNSAREKLKKIRDELAKKIQDKIPDVVINGKLERALPHMLNISVPGIDAEYVTLVLGQKGISVSTKSACREGEEGRSHVIYALGDAKSPVGLKKEERSENTIRISLGRDTSARDLMK